VVHLFSAEGRAYYGLEDIWGDAPRLEWESSAPRVRLARPPDESPSTEAPPPSDESDIDS
jgi:ribosome-associated protein